MSDSNIEPALFVHTRRPQWGLAILAEEEGNKRRFLFQDGNIRVFQEEFFHLLQPADKPLDVLVRVSRSLHLRLGKTASERSVLTSTPSKAMQLEDQIEVFRHLFPEGFADPAYIEKHRGLGAKKRLKRHLDAAVEDARTNLERSILDALVEEENFAELHERASAIVRESDLCAPEARKTVTQMPEEFHRDFGVALRDLLHGNAPHFDRFTRLVDVLQYRKGKDVKWTIATLFPALVFPEHHVSIEARPFAEEARWMAPQLVVGKTPDAVIYERLRKMAHRLFRELTERDMPPRDMLDVRTFIVQAFRPKNIEELKQSKRSVS